MEMFGKRMGGIDNGQSPVVHSLQVSGAASLRFTFIRALTTRALVSGADMSVFMRAANGQHEAGAQVEIAGWSMGSWAGWDQREGEGHRIETRREGEWWRRTRSVQAPGPFMGGAETPMHAAEQLVLPRVRPWRMLFIGFGLHATSASRLASSYTKQLRMPAAGVTSAGTPDPRTEAAACADRKSEEPMRSFSHLKRVFGKDRDEGGSGSSGYAPP